MMCTFTWQVGICWLKVMGSYSGKEIKTIRLLNLQSINLHPHAILGVNSHDNTDKEAQKMKHLRI